MSEWPRCSKSIRHAWIGPPHIGQRRWQTTSNDRFRRLPSNRRTLGRNRSGEQGLWPQPKVPTVDGNLLVSPFCLPPERFLRAANQVFAALFVALREEFTYLPP